MQGAPPCYGDVLLLSGSQGAKKKSGKDESAGHKHYPAPSKSKSSKGGGKSFSQRSWGKGHGKKSWNHNGNQNSYWNQKQKW